MLYVLVVLFASLSCFSCNVVKMREDPLMKTDINLIGADKSQMSTYQGNNVVINTNKMIAQASLANSAPDIEEDSDDPFITTGSGKPRPIFELEADEWVNDLPNNVMLPKSPSALSRVKRCGGNDDDGDANRARRRAARRRASRRRAARRRAAKKAKKAAKKAAKSRTETTVTTKVIQNGQVVSETSGAQPAVQSTVTTTNQQVQQPQVVQQTTTTSQQQAPAPAAA